MSSLKVELCQPDKIEPHPNADRLEIATVKGWNCVVGKGLTTDTLCVYFPIDAVLPDDLSAAIFADAKIKPITRIRTIKLRGVISQGLLVPVQQLLDAGVSIDKHLTIGDDVAKYLGVTKFEPKQPGANLRGNQASKKQRNPNFTKYTNIENFKNYQKVFEEGEFVVITEKIHGTNFRAGWVPMVTDSWWKKVKQFFGCLDKWEFVYGSHNVQLQNPPRKYKNTYYDKNVYLEAVRNYRLKEIIPKGYVLYGEIYGAGIQKGYDYGLKETNTTPRQLRIFDIKHNDVYVPHWEVEKYCAIWSLHMVPVLYFGEYSLEKAKELSSGPSTLWSPHVIEGIVIKPEFEKQAHCGRKILKLINDDYLLKKQTEWH